MNEFFSQVLELYEALRERDSMQAPHALAHGEALSDVNDKGPSYFPSCKCRVSLSWFLRISMDSM